MNIKDIENKIREKKRLRDNIWYHKNKDKVNKKRREKYHRDKENKNVN